MPERVKIDRIVIRAAREKFLFASETDTIILVSSCIKNAFLCCYYIP